MISSRLVLFNNYQHIIFPTPTASQYVRRAFSSLGLHLSRTNPAAWRPNSSLPSLRRSIHSSKPKRQDPFRNNEQQQQQQQPPKQPDPRRNGLILLASIAMTVFAYITMENSIKKAQTDMQNRMQSQIDSTVKYFAASILKFF